MKRLTSPAMMPAPQLVHIEEVAIDQRACTIAVVRVAGGLAGQWYCPCGEARTLPVNHSALEDALQDARLGLQQHHLTLHTDQGAAPS